MLNWWIIGAFCGFLIAISVTFNPVFKKVTGYTIKEFSDMRIDCEKELPRNKQCVPVLTFKVED